MFNCMFYFTCDHSFTDRVLFSISYVRCKRKWGYIAPLCFLPSPASCHPVIQCSTVPLSLSYSHFLFLRIWVSWWGSDVVLRRTSDREVASSIPGCSAARCNSGQVVYTHVPLFTKRYKLVPASAGGKVHHRSGVGYAGSHSAVNRRHSSIVSYLWLPLYSGLDVTSLAYAAIKIDLALHFSIPPG